MVCSVGVAAASGKPSRPLCYIRFVVAQLALFKCDFCGKETPRIRRIALDQGYDRLGIRHAARYACEQCSKAKEAQRRQAVDASAKPS